MGLLAISSLALLVGPASLSNGPSVGSDPALALPAEDVVRAGVGRDPITWPFSSDSIWNLPIGADAVYVHAGMKQATQMGMFVDENVLILEPDAPVTSVYYNDDAWSTIPGRCAAEGGVLFSAPIPSDFVVLGNGMGSPHGNTPNYATAILAPDGVTLYQGQPFAHCSAGGTATIWWYQTNERLDGLGNSGAHGGSMLSSIGGTIRLGELVPGGTIRHAVKLNLDSVNFYYDSVTRGYRWPATTADWGASGGYTGSTPAMRMGSLTALVPSFSVDSLETEPARILARALQDYGGYVVDSAGWSVYGLATEYSPDGDVMVEFNRVWGYPINAAAQSNAWARDMDRIFLNLHVVDTWNQAAWLTVSASDGLLGAGLGAARVSWAPGLGEDTVAPQAANTLAGTLGSDGWYRSPVTVTLTATDEGSGVASIHYRIDQGAWQVYSAPLTVSSNGPHAIEYYAEDIAGNQGPTQTVTFKIDTVPPTATAALSGTLGSDGWYRSPVSVTLTGADAGSGVGAIRLRKDGGAWQPYSGPETIASDGSHTVDYYATDVAGTQGATQTVTFKIDSVGPTATAALSGTLGPDGSYRSPVTITLTGADSGSVVASIHYRIDGGPWQVYSAPATVSSDGSHAVDYYAIDVAGNQGSTQMSTFMIDTTAPVSTHALTGTLGTSGWYISPVIVTLGTTGTNGSSASLEYALDGGPRVRYVAPFAVAEGRHVLEYQATYANGDLEAPKSVAIDVDYTAPTIVRGAPDARIPVDGTFSWLGFDAVSGVIRYEVSIDGGPSQVVGLEPRVTRTWTEGAHVAIVKAYDDAGNEATETFPFRVDRDAEAESGPFTPEPLTPGPLQMIPFVAIAFGLALLGLGAHGRARWMQESQNGRSHSSSKTRPVVTSRPPKAPRSSSVRVSLDGRSR